jgi:hypothetical protein
MVTVTLIKNQIDRKIDKKIDKERGKIICHPSSHSHFSVFKMMRI